MGSRALQLGPLYGAEADARPTQMNFRLPLAAIIDLLRTLRRTALYWRMPGNIQRNDILNVAGAFLTAYGWFAFFCFVYLVERWADAAPTSPDPAHGLIYSYNEHGWVRYFSAFQTTSCALLSSTSIPLFFVGVLVSPKRNVVCRWGWLSVGTKWDPDDPKRLQRVGLLSGAVAAPIIVFVLGPVLVTALNAAGIVWPSG